MSYQDDMELKNKLIAVVTDHGLITDKLLKKFTLTWSKDIDGSIQLDGYSLEWKYKNEIKKAKK